MQFKILFSLLLAVAYAADVAIPVVQPLVPAYSTSFRHQITRTAATPVFTSSVVPFTDYQNGYDQYPASRSLGYTNEDEHGYYNVHQPQGYPTNYRYSYPNYYRRAYDSYNQGYNTENHLNYPYDQEYSSPSTFRNYYNSNSGSKGFNTIFNSNDQAVHANGYTSNVD